VGRGLTAPSPRTLPHSWPFGPRSLALRASTLTQNMRLDPFQLDGLDPLMGDIDK